MDEILHTIQVNTNGLQNAKAANDEESFFVYLRDFIEDLTVALEQGASQ